MAEDRDVRPDADLFGGFGAKSVPERPEPTARHEPARPDPEGPVAEKGRYSSESGFLSDVGDEPRSQAEPRSPQSASDRTPNQQARPTEPEQTAAGEPDQPTVTEPEHDKQGLDLARSVAGRLKGMTSTPRQPVRRTRRRRSADPHISGARPDDRDPQSLTSAIGRLMRDQGWEVDVAVHGVMARWPSIVGAEMAQHCHPESYTDTELKVRTDSTAWATQVRLLAPELVRRLNAVLGDGTVTRVTVQGPNAPSWRKGPRTVRGGRGPRDTYG